MNGMRRATSTAAAPRRAKNASIRASVPAGTKRSTPGRPSARARPKQMAAARSAVVQVSTAPHHHPYSMALTKVSTKEGRGAITEVSTCSAAEITGAHQPKPSR